VKKCCSVNSAVASFILNLLVFTQMENYSRESTWALKNHYQSYSAAKHVSVIRDCLKLKDLYF
jgi:hypothetical protein